MVQSGGVLTQWAGAVGLSDGSSSISVLVQRDIAVMKWVGISSGTTGDPSLGSVKAMVPRTAFATCIPPLLQGLCVFVQYVTQW